MGKFDRRSRDQKRETKLQREAGRSRTHASMAYHGNKCKTDRLMMPLAGIETGIFETFVVSDRQLTDETVVAALERLIGQLRSGPSPSLDARAEGPRDEKDVVILNIRRNWERQAGDLDCPNRDERIGLLHTILGSIENWTTQSDGS